MVKRLPAVLLVPLLMAGLAACAEPPAERVDTARDRLERLSPEAQVHAPGAYRSARDIEAELDAELEAQEGRFAMRRSYDRAEELAASLEAATERLERAIDAEQTRLRGEIDRLATEARRAVEEARASIDEVPRASLPEDRADAWRGELSAAEAALEEVAQLEADDMLVEAQRSADEALQSARQVGTSVAALHAEIEQARVEAAARAARGEVTIPRAVLADGERLTAGAYLLRPGAEGPAVEMAPPGRWIEFVRNGTVAGRALAVVIPDTEMPEVAKAPGPRNAARVDWLRGGDYIRVWLHRDGMNYLVHLPPA